MISYEIADATTKRLLDQVCAAHHAPLKEHCTIEAMFAKDDDHGAPLHCLSQGGYNTFGYVTRTDVKRRAAGGPDAIVYLDFADWEAASIDERKGMIDHLLERISVRTSEKGEVLTDSAARPKLDQVKFDLRLNGFRSVVERNTTAAPESRQFAVAKNPFAQMTLPFFESPKPPEKKAKGKKGKSKTNDTADMTEAEKDAFVAEQLKQQNDKGRPGKPPEWSAEYQNLVTAIDAKLTAAKIETGDIARESLLATIVRNGEANWQSATAEKLMDYKTRVMDLTRAEVVAHFEKAAA